MRDELEYVVIVGQPARGRRHTEVTALGQHHILSPDTQLEILSKGNSKYIATKQCSGSRQQCCGSGINIPDPDFCPSRIPKQEQMRKGEKMYALLLFVDINITKLKIILYFCAGEEKTLG